MACTMRAILHSANIPVYDKEYSIANDLKKSQSLEEQLLNRSDFSVPANYPLNLKKKIEDKVEELE